MGLHTSHLDRKKEFDPHLLRLEDIPLRLTRQFAFLCRGYTDRNYRAELQLQFGQMKLLINMKR